MWVTVGYASTCTAHTYNHHHCILLCLFIPITSFVFSPVLNELFSLKHILTAEECSEVAGQGYLRWKDHLVLVLAAKPVEAVEEATEVMKLYDLNTQRLHGELMHQCIYMYDKRYIVVHICYRLACIRL